MIDVYRLTRVESPPGQKESTMELDGLTAAYADLYPRIFNYVMRTVMNRAVAEDIVADTFVKALAKWSSFENRGAGPEAWLYRIASNTMMDYYRRRRKEKEFSETCPPFDELAASGLLPDATLEQYERYCALHKALEKLKPTYRLAIVLHYFEEKSVKEVSQAMNCVVPTTKWRLHHGRRQLGAILNKEMSHHE